MYLMLGFAGLRTSRGAEVTGVVLVLGADDFPTFKENLFVFLVVKFPNLFPKLHLDPNLRSRETHRE